MTKRCGGSTVDYGPIINDAIEYLNTNKCDKGVVTLVERTDEESSLNEVKTALDVLIVTIRKYNAYAGSAWPSKAHHGTGGLTFVKIYGIVSPSLQKRDVCP